jgi:hypothetical protein
MSHLEHGLELVLHERLGGEDVKHPRCLGRARNGLQHWHVVAEGPVAGC